METSLNENLSKKTKELKTLTISEEKSLLDPLENNGWVEVEVLKRMVKKARLEGAAGYISFLSQAISEKKFKNLDQLKDTIDNDECSALFAMAPLVAEELKIAGLFNGLMDNLPQNTLNPNR